MSRILQKEDEGQVILILIFILLCDDLFDI
jgi:hypothetical protein